MFKVYHGDQASAVNVDDYYIRELSSGLDELIFEIPITDENYQYMLEEAPIVEEQKYVIKSIDADDEKAKVKCQIDIDEWQINMYVGFTNNSDTVYNTIQQVLSLIHICNATAASRMISPLAVLLLEQTPLLERRVAVCSDQFPGFF